MNIKINKITLLKTHSADIIQLEASFKEGMWPFENKATLDLKVAPSQAYEYIKKNFSEIDHFVSIDTMTGKREVIYVKRNDIMYPLKIKLPGDTRDETFPISYVLSSMAANDGCDGEPWDQLQIASEYIQYLEAELIYCKNKKNQLYL